MAMTKHDDLASAIAAMPIPGIVFTSGGRFWAGTTCEQHHLTWTEHVVHRINPASPWANIIHPSTIAAKQGG